MFQPKEIGLMDNCKKYSGIICALLISAAFTLASLVARRVLSGSTWYLFSSILRLVFGLAILYVMKRIYGKSAKEVLSFNGSKSALIAGIGFMIYFLYFVILMCVGSNSVSGLTPALLLTHLFFQQLTTGFYEELNFRALIMEAYFYGSKSIKCRLFYVFFSTLVFALLHLIGGGGLNSIIIPSLAGFCFAVMYLRSHNIIIPMLFHFVYDVLFNLTQYAQFGDSPLFLMLNHSELLYYGIIIAAFVISLIMLLRKEKPNRAC